MNSQAFISEITQGYSSKGGYISLGKGKLQNKIEPEAEVKIPLKTLNRHGLIAGATGTGKTKTLQIILEKLSEKGIPSLVMDIKGDLSGIAAPGDLSNKHIVERMHNLKMPYTAQGFPVELLSISNEKGIKLRATITEFGPILLSKILGLNNTQEGVLSVIFKFCDDNALPLIDLDDLKATLNFINNKKNDNNFGNEYGSISPASIGAIQRKIVALEQQGANHFFGEPSFDVEDLLKIKDGKGIINIIRLTDIQNKPQLFSTFMLSLLAEIYATFPEQGDAEQPKLCLFIDEAHLVFKEASTALLSQIETVVKLIRSKGIGIFFITQVPGDIPESVLSQLGLKVQHALRGFTSKDRKEIKKAVENYPISEFYDTAQTITELGIGEAFITALNEKGIPTPLVYTHLVAPQSRMDILSDKEIEQLTENSTLADKYNQNINPVSAYEILTKKIEKASNQKIDEPKKNSRKENSEKSFFEEIIESRMARDIGRTFTREITRSLLGILGIKKTYRRK